MSLTETVVGGTLRPDGTLELDEKPNLAAGRVTVVLRQEAMVMLPKDDPFWQRMQAMWAAQNACVVRVAREGHPGLARSTDSAAQWIHSGSANEHAL